MQKHSVFSENHFGASNVHPGGNMSKRLDDNLGISKITNNRSIMKISNNIKV